MTYAQACDLLAGLVNYEKLAKPRDGFKLDDIRRLLALGGDPQKKLSRTVLVAGTKGKGSVCHILESALRACGRTTGLFTSPHVRTVRERVRLDGAMLSKRAFAAAVAHWEPLVRRQPVSYFELTTALAVDVFARQAVDYAIVEVGLGGRLDATNLTDPDVSVITRIGLDHTRVLGGSLRLIAVEKAGIMRAGRPVVLARQLPAALRALKRCATDKGADVVSVDGRLRTWDVVLDAGGVMFSSLGELGAGRLRLPLLGRHQIDNANAALAALGVLARTDSRIRYESVSRGFEQVDVPARCQTVSSSPWIIVDSCHNPDSGAALAQVIREHLGRQVVLVYGSLRGKRITDTIRPLVPHVREAILTVPSSPRAASLTRLKLNFSRLGLAHHATPGIAEAMSLAFQLAAADDTPVVIAGSFYLAGEALDWLEARGSLDREA